jgi:hypothetical protein
MRRNLFLKILFAAVVFIYAVESGILTLGASLLNPFVIWNLIPVIICYFLYTKAEKNGSLVFIWGSLGFLILGIGPSVIFHLLWIFDKGDANDALIFIFIPIYSAGLGFVGYFIGTITARIYQHFKR